MEQEQWLTIVEAPDYAVSDQGRVRNNYTGRILAIVRTADRYSYVGLRKDHCQIKRGVAKLVLEGFVLKPAKYDANFDTPIHLNGDPYDCWAVNLQWRPKYFAVKHRLQFRRRTERSEEIFIRDKKTGKEFGIWEAVTRFGLLYSDILMSIEHCTYVFPTMQTFEWAE